MKWYPYPEKKPEGDGVDCVVITWRSQIIHQRWYETGWGSIRPSGVVYWTYLKNIPKVKAADAGVRNRFLTLMEGEEERQALEEHYCKRPRRRTGRKRMLDTPEEIEKVCDLYYLTERSVSDIARSMNVSAGVIDRVLKENGQAYSAKNRKAIEEWRRNRKT